MNMIKFIGKVLALPINIVKSLIILGLLPIKALTNWLGGYGRYNKIYLKFSKLVTKYAIEAAKRGEKPILENIIQYHDDYKLVTFFNNKRCPCIANLNRTTRDENGNNFEQDFEVIS